MDERPVAHPVPASDLDARDELQALSSLPLEERFQLPRAGTDGQIRPYRAYRAPEPAARNGP